MRCPPPQAILAGETPSRPPAAPPPSLPRRPLVLTSLLNPPLAATLPTTLTLSLLLCTSAGTRQRESEPASPSGLSLRATSRWQCSTGSSTFCPPSSEPWLPPTLPINRPAPRSSLPHQTPNLRLRRLM